MGLDIMALRVKKEDIINDTNISEKKKYFYSHGEHNIYDWRGFHELNHWMKRLHYEKGGKGEIFEGDYYERYLVRITEKDLDVLDKDKDIDDPRYDIFIEIARKVLQENDAVYYHCCE